MSSFRDLTFTRHVIDGAIHAGCIFKPVIFPELARFTDVALLLLRIMIGLVFIVSGWKHLKNPEERSKDIGLSKGFTIFLGAAEIAGSLGVMFGVLAQLAAAGLILIMLGAIQKKIFIWHTGFWGSSGTNGWSYDTMLVVMNLVILTTGGGSLSVMNWLFHFS
ncbi:MAG: DoxX family protein [Candidatus Udaeobacter sp.]